jgi:hypothetical protein
VSLTAAALNAELGFPAGTGIVPFAEYHLILAGITAPGITAQAALGPAFTLIVQGRVAAMWGLVILWPGVAEGWMIATAHLKPVGAAFTWWARRFNAIAAQSLDLRRTQIHVQTSNDAFIRWAIAAKFKREATLEAYAPDGSDVYVMSRIWRRT